MSFHEREGLIARVRQMRRTPTPSAQPAETPPPPDALHALEVRVAHLEQMLQGLQDSVHRESERHGDRIAELEARTQPAVLGKALIDDARERGL